MIELRSGFSHAVAVLEDGDVYVWGRMQSTDVKAEGRVPVFHDQLYPRKVDVGGGRVVEAFCSSFNTLLRMEDGRCGNEVLGHPLAASFIRCVLITSCVSLTCW